jgi:hypothetical protein
MVYMTKTKQELSKEREELILTMSDLMRAVPLGWQRRMLAQPYWRTLNRRLELLHFLIRIAPDRGNGK